MGNRIEVRLTNGDKLRFEGTVDQLGRAHVTASGLIAVEELDEKVTVWINPTQVVCARDLGPMARDEFLSGKDPSPAR